MSAASESSIPDAHRAIVPHAGGRQIVGRDCDLSDRPMMADKSPNAPARRRLKHSNLALGTGRKHKLAPAVERDG